MEYLAGRSLGRPLALVVWLTGWGCGSPEKHDTASLDTECSPFPVPEDALVDNDLHIGGRGYVCYLPSPEGVCVAVSGAEAAAVVADQGAEAAGCSSGVVVIDGTCPADLVVGTCTFADTGEVWTLYPCNRWDDLPGGEASGCESAGGSWADAA